MGGALLRSLEESLSEACSSPCMEGVCRELLQLLVQVKAGGASGSAALRVLARLVGDAAEYAEAAGCVDEAAALSRASLAARALASLYR